jgi:hypothetical protein
LPRPSGGPIMRVSWGWGIRGRSGLTLSGLRIRPERSQLESLRHVCPKDCGWPKYG